MTTIPADVVAILDPWMVETADVYPYNLPDAAIAYSRMSDMRAAVKASGSDYFSRAARAFFNAQTHSASMIGGRFWVESVRCDWNDACSDPDRRQYRVSWVSAYGDHLSIEHTRDFATLAEARAAAKLLAKHYGASA